MDRSDLPLLPLALCLAGWGMYLTLPEPFVRLTSGLLPVVAGLVGTAFWFFGMIWLGAPRGERDAGGPQYLALMALAGAGLAALVWQTVPVYAMVQLVLLVPPVAAALVYGVARMRLRVRA